MTIRPIYDDLPSTPDPLPPNYKPMQSIKRFGHDVGLSCAFRQWRANSHCRYVHGYALSFTFTFAAQTLNGNNWVVDFGSCKPLEEALRDMFDHKLLVAADDPLLPQLRELGDADGADVFIVPAVGCEAFAKFAFDIGSAFLANHINTDLSEPPRVWLVSVDVAEHGANAVTCFG